HFAWCAGAACVRRRVAGTRPAARGAAGDRAEKGRFGHAHDVRGGGWLMFTGLVDDVGTIERVRSTDAGLELRIRCRYGDLVDGESIAVNGACLTVREFATGGGVFTCAAVSETLAVTSIGEWKSGRRVNLERALRVGDRLG